MESEVYHKAVRFDRPALRQIAGDRARGGNPQRVCLVALPVCLRLRDRGGVTPVTALEPPARRTEDGDVIWKCRCGCGKEFEASSRKLLRGSVKDCGCKLNLTQKWIGRRFGDLTVVAFEGKKDHRNMWRCRCDCGNEVVVREICLKNGHTTSCGCKVDPSRYCHFVDGTFVEAIQARTMLKNNTSGVRGVYLNQRTQRWVARIGFRGKTYYLGSFENLEDAKKARKLGEEMTFDTFLRRYREEESG